MPISADLATVAATDVRPKTSAPDAVGSVQNSDADFAATYERERQAQSAAEGGLPEASSLVEASNVASDIQSALVAEGAVDDEALLASSEDTEASDEVAPDTTAVQELLLPLDLTSVTPPLPNGAGLPSAQASADHEAALITATSASLAADGLDGFTGNPEVLTAKVSEDRTLAPSGVSVDEVAPASETPEPVAGRQTDGTTVETDPVVAANTALFLARTLGSSMSATAPDASVTANVAASELETTPAALLERGILAARMAQISGQAGLSSAPEASLASTVSGVSIQSDGLPSELGTLQNTFSTGAIPLAEEAVFPTQTSVQAVASVPRDLSSVSAVLSQPADDSVVETEALPHSGSAPQVMAASTATPGVVFGAERLSSIQTAVPTATAVAAASPLGAVGADATADVLASMPSSIPALPAVASGVSLGLTAQPSNAVSPSVAGNTPTASTDLQGDSQSASSTIAGASNANNAAESAVFSEPTVPSLAEDRSLAESSPERAPDTSLSTGSSKESLNTPSTPRLPVVVGQPLALQKSEWSQAAVDRVMWMSSQNLQSAEIRLDPAELGRMEVRIDMVKDQAQVTFMSAQAGVRDALESQLPRLRELFSQQGMNLLDVNVSDQSSSGAWQGSSEQGRGQRNSAQDSLMAIESDEAVFGTMDASTSRKDSTRSLVDYYA